MKGQDVMTSNVACHAMLWTEHPKTQNQQKHDIGGFHALFTLRHPRHAGGR